MEAKWKKGEKRSQNIVHLAPFALDSAWKWQHLFQTPAPNTQLFKPWSQLLSSSLSSNPRCYLTSPRNSCPLRSLLLQGSGPRAPVTLPLVQWFPTRYNPGIASPCPGCCAGPSNTLQPIHIKFHLLKRPIWVLYPTKPWQVQPLITLWIHPLTTLWGRSLFTFELSLREVK